jgi:branched-subunit amino acid aminotransferase/4-amino-4-deoxychorismate lyase
MRAYTVPTRGQRTASQGMTKHNIIQMRAYTVPTRGQRIASRMEAYTVPTMGQWTASREITKWNMIQMRAYNVPTRGQRTASRETTKGSIIQTRIWPPTLNTERHGILIVQIWIKNLNHIKNSKNIILNKIKHSNTAEPAKWRGQWKTDKQRCAVYIQTKGNITRWSDYTRQPPRLSALSHAFYAWLTIQLNW